jgi:hypothetical protein
MSRLYDWWLGVDRAGRPPTASWMTIEEELPQRMHETIRATKAMLTVFFNPIEFTPVNLLPQGTSFAAAYFADNVTIPSANQHAQQRGHRRSQAAFAFPQFQVPHCSGCPRIADQTSVRPCSPSPVFTRLGRRRLLLVRDANATTLQEDF